MKLLTVPVLLATLTALGAELKPVPEQHLIPRAPAKVTIDGKLEEWDMATAYVVDPEQQPADQRLAPPGHDFDGPADLNGRILLAWDETYFYVATRVVDDHLRGIEPGLGHTDGPAGWACDSVMLVARSFRQPLYRPGPHLPIALRYSVPDGGRGELLDYKGGAAQQTHLSWKLPKDTRFAVTETANGWQAEAAMPWAELHFQARAGEPLDICFLLADIDPDKPLKQLGWQFPDGVRFRLDGGSGGLGLLTVARDQLIAAKEPQAVRYQVDAVAGPVTLDTLRITGPAGLDRAVPIGVTVPAAQRAQDLLVVRDLPDTIGPAFAILEATINGKAVVLARQPFEIVAARPAPPRVSNPLGEIVRMSPERTYHHAREDRRRNKIRYHFVKDSSGYERWLLEHVKKDVDAIEAQLPAMQKPGAGVWAAAHVAPVLALYRLTGDEKYSGWIPELIDAQLRFLESDAPREQRLGRMISLIWPRYFTWQQDPDTPLAPPDAEERWTRLWADFAANPPELFASEWGYHNRCWHRWRDAKLMMHFAEQRGTPVDPMIREYVAWHDERLIPLGDSTDNSSGYNWLTPDYYLLVQAALGKLDTALDNEGMLATVQRLRDYFAPNGALPNWGDTSGWMTGLAAGFSYTELLSRLTGDGSFRYVGHRTAEYLYNFIWDEPNQYHMVKDHINGAFAMSYLFADDAIGPRGLPGGSRIIEAKRTVPLTAEEKDARPGLSFGRLTDELMADKAVLQSGNDPFGFWAFVELRDTGGHSGILPGNLCTIMSESAVLYGGQGYWDSDQGDNNVVWVEDLEGLAGAGGPVRTGIPAFADDGALTWLRVRTQNYGGLPITSTRDILFVKNGAIVVRDKLDFHATIKVRLGPCWHTRKVGPQCGEDWFNTYYEKLYSTGLGVGRGVHVTPNPAWDMLIAYAPRNDCSITVTDRYDDNPWRVSPIRLQQWWSGIVRTGESRTFVSVLLPHVPAFDVTGFRERIEFAVDTPESLLVRLPRADNPRKPLGGNTITLQLHDGDGPLAAGDWQCDARVAMVEHEPDGKVRQAVLVDGAFVTAAGDDLTARARQVQSQVVQTTEAE